MSSRRLFLAGAAVGTTALVIAGWRHFARSQAKQIVVTDAGSESGPVSLPTAVASSPPAAAVVDTFETAAGIEDAQRREGERHEGITQQEDGQALKEDTPEIEDPAAAELAAEDTGAKMSDLGAELPPEASLMDEVMLRMAHRRPELAGLEAFSPEASERALAPHRAELVEVMDAVMERRRAVAAMHPVAADVVREHEHALERADRTHRPLVVAGGPDPPQDAAGVAYATLAQEGRLRALPLGELHTTSAPRQGAVVGGVIAAPFYELVTETGTAGYGFLLRGNDGAVCRLMVLNCTEEQAMGA